MPPAHPAPFACKPTAARPAAFTLIELLVVIAIIAVLVSILLPTLARAREAGRASVCLSNLRQCFIACRAYADDNKGIGPAIGQPYATLPNWRLVVQANSGRDGSGNELYNTTTCLVCPTIDVVYRGQGTTAGMLATYAMNATGHSGLPRPAMNPPMDPDSFDVDPQVAPSAPIAKINFDSVLRTSDTPLLMDSSVDASQAGAPGSPPPTRTASVLDFRLPAHVSNRLGLFHTKRFQWVAFDGSAKNAHAPLPHWADPLP